MPVERLTDLTDSRVAAYGSLTDDGRLRAAGLFVAEGRLVVRRVLENKRFRVRSILVNDAARASLLPQLAKLDARVPVFLCETAAFQPLTGHHIHRGCLALVERPRPTSLASLLDSTDWKRREPDSLIHSPETHGSRRTVLIALDGVGNPDNIGGVFRNAAAFSAPLSSCLARAAAIPCTGKRSERRWPRRCRCRTRPSMIGRVLLACYERAV